MIAFLHTSPIHIEKFEKIVRKNNTNIEIKHFVNESLLDNAIRTGNVNSQAFQEEIEAIHKENPTLFICTCSTLGNECDKYNFINRIDEPIAKYLAENYKNIGLAFTANSTENSSSELLNKAASIVNKTIHITPINCSEHWQHYETKNFNLYERGIANTIESIADTVDVIFLAQASMEGALKHLNHLKEKIKTSPEFGVSYLLTKNDD